jgi:hypothetical protein
MDIDFKRNAQFMSETEFRAAYERILPLRQTDMTP